MFKLLVFAGAAVLGIAQSAVAIGADATPTEHGKVMTPVPRAADTSNVRGAVAPTLTYTPTTAAGVQFPGGPPGPASATIQATPTGGAGTGAAATTTLSGCTASTGFTITNAPINFSFVGNTAVSQLTQLSCIRGGTAQTGTLSCAEQQGANPAVTRTWSLTCPQAMVDGPTLAYAPAPPGPVAFGSVTVGTNPSPVQNIVVTPSGGAGGGMTTLGSCAITGTNAAEFGLLSAAALTFPAGGNTPQNLGLRFTPVAPAGPKTATVACTEARQNGAMTIRVWNLTGIAAVNPVTVVPGSGNPQPGSTINLSGSASQTITFANSSAAAVALTCAVAPTGAFVVNPVPLNIPANGTASVSVSLQSGQTGSTAATLTCTPAIGAPLAFNLVGFSPAAVNALSAVGLWAMLGLMLGTGLAVVASRRH